MHDCIEINVSGRKATLIKTIDLPTGNKDSIKVLFYFDDKSVSWSSAVKLAFFASVTPTGLKRMLPAVIEADNIAALPSEIIDTTASMVLVGVNGTMPDGSTQATNMVLIGKTTFGANSDETGYDFSQPEEGYFDKFLSELAQVLSENNSIPCAHINEKGELIIETGGGIVDARINEKGELEVEVI